MSTNLVNSPVVGYRLEVNILYTEVDYKVVANWTVESLSLSYAATLIQLFCAGDERPQNALRYHYCAFTRCNC